VAPPSACPSVQQKPTEGYKYRAEYSTFLAAVPLQSNSKLTFKTVQVASPNEDSPSDRDFVSATIKQDNDDVESVSSSQTRLEGNRSTEASQDSALKVEDFRLIDDDKPACVSAAARPAALPAEVSTVEDSTVTDNTADRLMDSYVVTYESENIVVLDREPVIDCLTPDGDVVSTQVRQLLTTSADSSGTASGEAGLSRSLPLSESGYDTWKSSDGSVAVVAGCVASTCVAAPDLGAEQQQGQSDDGTLRVCSPSKTFDAQSVQLSDDKNVYTEGSETCQPDAGESSALFRDADNLSLLPVLGAMMAQRVMRRTCDQVVAGSTFGRAAAT